MRYLIPFLLIPTLAQAQTTTPEAQALAQKLMSEISISIQCSTTAIISKQENEKLTVEVKRLKDKYEPEAQPDAK